MLKKNLQAAELAINEKEGKAKSVKVEKELEKVMDLLMEEQVDDYIDISEEDEPVKKKHKADEPTVVPLNFSQVTNYAQPGKAFPEFKKAVEEIETLHAGEMLFLPAGWFHEVTSRNNSEDNKQGHMAFNYWMHPGDSKDFHSPYTCKF